VFFKHGERFRDLVGSPYYVAPEVLRKNYSHEADMWCVALWLLAVPLLCSAVWAFQHA
jgi:calcium-dependent protein kinase